MKYLIIFILCLFGQSIKAQDITVVRLSNGGIYLETEKTNNWGGGMGSSKSKGDEYYVNAANKKILIGAVKKAIEWYDLNTSHQKTFTKELNRIKVMDKQQYEFHGYVSAFTQNVKIIFEGNSNGGVVSFYSDQGLGLLAFIELKDREAITGFLNILQGKSANAEIDNIFKN